MLHPAHRLEQVPAQHDTHGHAHGHDHNCDDFYLDQDDHHLHTHAYDHDHDYYDTDFDEYGYEHVFDQNWDIEHYLNKQSPDHDHSGSKQCPDHEHFRDQAPHDHDRGCQDIIKIHIGDHHHQQLHNCSDYDIEGHEYSIRRCPR